MKVVSFKICPFVERITALLAAKKLAYELEYIRLSAKPKWFLELSPNGQVPLLITDSGRALFESDAIAEYLEEAYPPLQSHLSAEDRAVNRAWSYLATKHYLVQCGAQRSADEPTLRKGAEKLTLAFDKVTRKLEETPFFNGDSPGMVDIAWSVILHRANIIEKLSGFDFLVNHPRLKEWQKNLMATGISKQAVAEDFEEAFSAFYLSEETYLGRSCRALS